MNTDVKNQMIEFAEKTPNEESCGFLYVTFTNVGFMPCENIAANKMEYFEISKEDYFNCLKLGNIVGIFHSHTARLTTGFTQDDMDTAEEMEVPIYLYHLGDKSFKEYIPPSYNVNLEGQMFIFGQQDCFSLVRHYYRQKHQIFISDYDRDEHYLHQADNRILDNFSNEGFVDIKIAGLPQKEDVFVFSNTRDIPQHFAIFMGQGRVLHHPLGSLSKYDPFNGSWMRKCKLILRHESF